MLEKNQEINNRDMMKMESKHKKMFEWADSKERKRLLHLETLILKTYETVNIKADRYCGGFGHILDNFTRVDYLEDYEVFFKPEVFDKLKDWCREYEALRKEEDKIFCGEV